MKIYLLRRQQLIAKPLQEVFDFFKNPENLKHITPPSLNFHILTPMPIRMEKGTVVDYTIRVLGTYPRWTTMITEFDPPHRFVDVQLNGPYSYWHHTHLFQEMGQSTLVIDEVRYAMPFGLLGNLARKLFVARQLEDIFNFRADSLRVIFSGQ